MLLYLERLVDVKHKAGREALWLSCWKDWMLEKKVYRLDARIDKENVLYSHISTNFHEKAEEKEQALSDSYAVKHCFLYGE